MTTRRSFRKDWDFAISSSREILERREVRRRLTVFDSGQLCLRGNKRFSAYVISFK